MDLRKSPLLLYYGAWTLVALYFCLRDLFSAPLHLLLLFNFAHFGAWAVLGRFAIPLMRRHPLRASWRPWVFHLIVGILFTQADITIGHLIFHAATGTLAGRTLGSIAFEAFCTCFHMALLTYWGMLGIVQGLDAQRRSHRQALQLVEHKAAFAEAQLQALRSQLQPHFLFNALHAVSSFMHYDVPTADRLLNRLSELLRITLRDGMSREVSLRTEIGFVEAYLEIEKIRFEHRLQVTVAVPADLQEATIPPLILQPLVENAVKYGVAPRAAGGSVIVRAYEDAAQLVLEVEDDAPENLPREKGFGIGLGNTRSRLEALYGEGRLVELVRAGMGTIARVRLPLIRAPQATAPGPGMPPERLPAHGMEPAR